MSASGARMLEVLEHLAAEGFLSIQRIAEDLDLNKATAHRLVRTLCDTGYLRQDPTTRQYGPTTKILRLADTVLLRIDIRYHARPHLEALAEETNETVHLAVLEGLEIAYVDKVDGNQAVIMKSRVGGRGHCHSTSLGKLLLAYQPEPVWRRYVDEIGLPARTANTVTDPDAFFAMLTAVREAGYAIDDVENEEGIRCVAAPIFDHRGEIEAAVSLSGWTLSMSRQRAETLRPIIMERAARLSAELGAPAEVG